MLILGGKEVEVPGLVSVNWKSGVPKATDLSRRKQWIRAIVLHTVHGRRGSLKPGGVDRKLDLQYAKYQARTPREVSWDYTIDLDGSVAVSNDPAEFYTWHAGSVNPLTIGIELGQESDGTTYEDQYTKGLVPLVSALCDYFGIQKQVPVRNGAIDHTVIERLAGPDMGRDVVGVYGHRNQTRNRGFGDPGDHAFKFLLEAGFEGFDFHQKQDLDVWRERQRALGLMDIDGVAGPNTVKKLKESGKPHGVWVNQRA